MTAPDQAVRQAFTSGPHGAFVLAGITGVAGAALGHGLLCEVRRAPVAVHAGQE